MSQLWLLTIFSFLLTRLYILWYYLQTHWPVSAVLNLASCLLLLDVAKLFFLSFDFILTSFFGDTSHDLFFPFYLLWCEHILCIVFLLFIPDTVFWVSPNDNFRLSAFWVVFCTDDGGSDSFIFLCSLMGLGEKLSSALWERSERIFFDLRGISMLRLRM